MTRPSICKSCLIRLSRRQQSTKAKPKTTTPAAASAYTPLSTLPPTAISYYWDTNPPTPTQLSTANDLFTPSPPHSPVKLFSASRFVHTPQTRTSIPEVAFLGRSNVGKSSLLNALMGMTGAGKEREICYTSSKPGRTREMNGFGVGARKGGGSGWDSRVVVLDMPGYGKGSREEWGVEILKYIRGRRELRRTFLLIDALHGPKPADHQLLSLLRQHLIPHQIILSKIDKILLPASATGKSHKALAKRGVSAEGLQKVRSLLEGLRPVVQPAPASGGGKGGKDEGPGALGEILTCSSETIVGPKGRALGIDAIRWAVCAAAGIDGTVDGGVSVEDIKVI